MRRSNDLTLTPDVLVDRLAFTGGVFAVAAKLGTAVGQSTGTRETAIVGKMVATIPGVVFDAPERTATLLGLELVDAECIYGFSILPDGTCTVIARSSELSAAHCEQRAVRVAQALRAQLVTRQVLAGLRDWQFTILEREAAPDAVLTQRARLPLSLRPRPSARTTRADFVLTVDHDGTVSVRINPIRSINRQSVADLLHAMLSGLAPSTGHATIRKAQAARNVESPAVRTDAA